jgi:hypothetical protein
MKKAILLAATLLAPLSASAQYYGVVDNFQGSERYPDFVNLTSKNGATANNFNFDGNGAGWGAGEAADVGPAGVGDRALDGGGALNGTGFAGHNITFNTAIDFATVSNGRQNTGIRFDFMDQQFNGDVWTVRVDGPDFANAKTFTITPTGNSWESYAFDFNMDGVVSGAFNPANITGIVLTPATDNGDFAFRFDNLALTGNYEPTDGLIEDFEGYTVGNLGAGAGPLANLNSFDGVVETFVFGAGAVTDSEIADIGGNKAGSWTFSTTEGGLVFDLGLPGAQADLTNYTTLEIELAVTEAGDEVAVLVEDINAPTYASRCAATPAVTTTLQTFTFALDSVDFTCGAQGLDKSLVHRVTVLPANTQGNGVTIIVGRVAFTNGASSVGDWDLYEGVASAE